MYIIEYSSYCDINKSHVVKKCNTLFTNILDATSKVKQLESEQLPFEHRYNFKIHELILSDGTANFNYHTDLRDRKIIMLS